MREYDFTLKFDLGDCDAEADIYVERLYAEGCDDALIGVGKKGYIALNFIRESSSAFEAVKSAISSVKKVIPQAILVEASPDLVGVKDVANILQCSRQNVRQLMLKGEPSSPPPVYEGAQAIWHLSDVLTWLVKYKAYQIDESLIELAQTNMNLNIARDSVKLDPNMQRNFQQLVTFN